MKFAAWTRPPFGAKVVKPSDITLGLPLISSVSEVLPCDHNGQKIRPVKVKVANAVNHAILKPIKKITKRAAEINNTITPIPKRCLFWSTYCQSILYYISSIFTLRQAHLRMLERIQQKVLIGRPWLRANFVTSIFSALKIAPATDLQTSCAVANVGLVNRMHGAQVFLASPTQLPTLPFYVKNALRYTNKHCHALSFTTQSADVSPTHITPSPTLLPTLKKHLKELHHAKATDYIEDRIARTTLFRLLQRSPQQLLKLFHDTQHKAFPPMDRIYCLRWLLDEDTDAFFALRLQGLSRQGTCANCLTATGFLHPIAYTQQPICVSCFSFRYPQHPPWCYHLPAASRAHLEAGLTPPYPSPLSPALTPSRAPPHRRHSRFALSVT